MSTHDLQELLKVHVQELRVLKERLPADQRAVDPVDREGIAVPASAVGCICVLSNPLTCFFPAAFIYFLTFSYLPNTDSALLSLQLGRPCRHFPTRDHL